MGEHASRSPSASPRWINCPGSEQAIALAKIQDQSSQAAAEGTAAHALGELCLKTGSNTADYADQWIVGDVLYTDKPNEDLWESAFVIDSEMVEAVGEYVTHCRSLETPNGETLIEQRVDMSSEVPDCWGTADFIHITTDGHLHVVDLKYGKGIKVFAEENPQLMLYAFGAYCEFELLYDISKITVHIVQPRLGHFDDWELNVEDLMAFIEVAKSAVIESKSADPSFQAGEKQCQWCPVAGSCKTLKDHTLEIIKAEIDELGLEDDPMSLPDLNLMTNEEIAEVLPHISLINKWIKSLEAKAASEIEVGRDIPGFKLVEGRANRAWSLSEDEMVKKLRNAKLKQAEYFNFKLISPAQAEKLLGKEHRVLKKYVDRPDGKPTLVPVTDKRQAIVFDDFNELEDSEV